MKCAYHYYPQNLDHNSGNPLGISLCQLTARDRYRVTASGAYLSSQPRNLTIRTEAAVEKILFQRKKAVGVEVNGTKGILCLLAYVRHIWGS